MFFFNDIICQSRFISVSSLLINRPLDREFCVLGINVVLRHILLIGHGALFLLLLGHLIRLGSHIRQAAHHRLVGTHDGSAGSDNRLLLLLLLLLDPGANNVWDPGANNAFLRVHLLDALHLWFVPGLKSDVITFF